jgi:hypothetical protein
MSQTLNRKGLQTENLARKKQRICRILSLISRGPIWNLLRYGLAEVGVVVDGRSWPVDDRLEGKQDHPKELFGRGIVFSRASRRRSNRRVNAGWAEAGNGAGRLLQAIT